MNGFYRCLFCYLLVYSLFSISFAFQSEAKYAIILDYNNNEILYKKNSDEITTPSSMTKVMTAYLIFDLLKDGKIKLNDTFKTSVRAWRQEGSRMFLEPDKNVTIENLLKGLIVVSGNDSAVALAEGSYGTIENFVDKMNQKAKQLKLNDTHFINPTGLFHKNHYMSVKDIAILTQNLIKNHKNYYEMFFNIEEFEFNGINQRNRNWVLFEYEGADGVKTGHTDVGGYALIGSAERHGQRFITVVNGLKTDRERIIETKKLLDYAFSLYSYIDLYKKNEIIDTLDVKGGDKNFINVYSNVDIIYSFKTKEKDNVSIEKIYRNDIKAPVKRDEIIGYIEFKNNDKITKFNLLAKNEVKKVDFFEKTVINFKKLIGIKL